MMELKTSFASTQPESFHCVLSLSLSFSVGTCVQG
jgi:hypothetical protein